MQLFHFYFFQFHPLQREIARLTAENNHLHADLIRFADEADAKEKRALQAQEYEKRIEKMGEDFLLRNPDHPYTNKKRAADQALIKKMQDEKIALLQKKSNEKSDQFTTFIDRYISILNCDYDSCGCGGGENCKSC